jgi:hypothetical protein
MSRAGVALAYGVLLALASWWLADEQDPLGGLLAWIVVPALAGAIVRWWGGPRAVGALPSGIAGAIVVVVVSAASLALPALVHGDRECLDRGHLDWDVPAMLAGVGALFGLGGGAIMDERMRREENGRRRDERPTGRAPRGRRRYLPAGHAEAPIRRRPPPAPMRP